MARTTQRRAAFPLTGLVAGVVALAIVATTGPRVSASELLQNGDFANWAGSDPEGWSVSPSGSAERDADCGCAMLTGSATSLSQYVTANAGATYSARVTVSPGAGLSEALLIVTFLDAGLLALGNAVSITPAPPGPATIEAEAVAPEGTAYAEFRVQLSGSEGAVGFVSGASLVETVQATPIPTPTPTASPAASATAGNDTPEPSSSSGATATRTGTPTKTATPPKSPTATKTPTSPGGSTPPPGTGAGPLLDDGRGGLLLNGGFEHVRDNAPVGWSKYGGTLASAEFGAYEGSWAAALNSMTLSTKWAHQVVPITGGEWYRGTAVGKLTSGKGEVFIRMSWYASYDGSGSALSQVDSNIATGYDWTFLDTGPVPAPAGAKSVRFRLMIRPSEPSTAMFDAAVLVTTEAPTPTPTPTVPPTGTTPPPQPPGETPAEALASPTAQSAGGSTQQGAQPAAPAAASGPATLRISEVMADPLEPGNDAAFEWVEIVNAGSIPVNTAGWRIGDGQTTDAIPETILAPGGYLVIAGPEAVFDEGVAVVRVADGRIGNGLNNTGDLVRLLAPDGTLIDNMSYGENSEVFDPPPAAAGPGATLGIHNPGGTGPANWATTREPTPGRPNLFDEEPPVTEASATVAMPSGPSRTPGTTPTAGHMTAGQVVEEREGSMLPWLVLAAAGGAGAVGATMATRRAVPRILERVRRRSGD